jgi:RNA polymerase sigma factor (sigma-70 family)
MAEASTTLLQVCIERMNGGDASARDQLIYHTGERLRRLTRKMLQDFRRVKEWEDTDDVLQNTLMRLLKALRAVPPTSVAEFFRLAATQIRRELIDLARHYYGPQGPGARRADQAAESGPENTPRPAYEQSTDTYDPSRLAIWSEFHREVEALPEEERDVFDLLWYVDAGRSGNCPGSLRKNGAAPVAVGPPTVASGPKRSGRETVKSERLIAMTLDTRVLDLLERWEMLRK